MRRVAINSPHFFGTIWKELPRLVDWRDGLVDWRDELPRVRMPVDLEGRAPASPNAYTLEGRTCSRLEGRAPASPNAYRLEGRAPASPLPDFRNFSDSREL